MVGRLESLTPRHDPALPPRRRKAQRFVSNIHAAQMLIAPSQRARRQEILCSSTNALDRCQSSLRQFGLFWSFSFADGCCVNETQFERTRETVVASVVTDLVRELRQGRAIEITASSRLENDLGIDSLARTELTIRLERALKLRLPGLAIAEAETLTDLFRALEQARPLHEPVVLVKPEVTRLEAVAPAANSKTLLDVLKWHEDRHPERVHLTLLEDEHVSIESLTYHQLADAARRLAQRLIAREIATGDRVALMLPTGRDFFIAFFAVLYAGGVPVPIYPPIRPSQVEDHLRRQALILNNAGARMLVTVAEARPLAALLGRLVTGLADLTTLQELSEEECPASRLPVVAANDSALIQYTSGSTGEPKGVVLSHANLLANIRAMGHVMQASSTDVFVSWLPLYHDMGLIGAWFGCLHYAASLYIMSPVTFLVRPESWLWAIHRFRATLSAAPNFAFELCLNKIDEENLAGLDLSSLRMVANGAEPVSAQTLRRFIGKFERFGFQASAMAPVYGLAENSVGLAFPPLGRVPLIDRIDRDALSQRQSADIAAPVDTRPLEIVACGQPLPGHEVRIVDEFGHELGERQEGRLEFRGPSATSGYFQNDRKTAELIRNGWLDSGDRAYIAAGDIFVTGRIKDIIIRAGRHIYPQEIEEAVAEIEGIRKGCVAVFGLTDRKSGTERVVVLAETRERDPSARAKLQELAQAEAALITGAPPDEVVLVPPRTVPKTSSGKIRRSAAKDLYASGAWRRPTRSPWRQLLRLYLSSMGPQFSRSSAAVGRIAYAGWWWLVVATGFAVAWSVAMVLPEVSWRWRAVRAAARAAFACLGVPIDVLGLQRVPQGNAILVFNHSSYMDVPLLAAFLPREPAFIAKRELATQAFAGPFLRRMGTLFVERTDVSLRLSDAEAIAAVGRDGRNLIFFPEGTFTRRPGLSAFHLGAFKVAADTSRPVLPGVIRGTRSMLRSDQWFPQRSALSLHIEDPIQPTGSDFASVVQLRDAVRARILAESGEPDLDEMVAPPGPTS
jgi:1-acyl-sn-glycerol-3-phosphate acyltransferase